MGLRFSAAAGTLKSPSPSTPGPRSAPRRQGRKMLIRLTLAAGLALLLVTAPAHPWGAFRGVAGLKVTDTHQQILKAAYALLCNDPAMRPGNGIPTARGQALTIFQILEHEGVDASLSMAPVGPGPDAEGSTLYSTHWFNPSTGKGLGPQATAEWYQRFIQAVLGIAGSDQDACKGLAWSAHYLADMFVPYHLNGMPSGEALARLNARNFVIGPVEAGPGFLIDPVPPAPQRETSLFSDQYGQIRQTVSSWWRQGWGVDSIFQGPYTIFAAHFQAAQRGDGGNHLDWFDPWYWNGLSSESGNLTDIGRSLFSSHASYESAAHERFVAGGGYVPSPDRPTPYDPLWRNAAPDFSFSGSPWQAQAWQVHDFASRVAARTLQNAELFWRQPEVAIRASVEAVYTMWRSAFSALKPAIETGVDPARPDAGLLIKIKTRNAALEACRDVRVRVSVGKAWGQFAFQRVVPLARPISARTGAETTVLAQVDPAEPWVVFVEVVGAYDRTPDLQYASAVKPYYPEPQRKPARPVEAAAAADFVGRFQFTDPTRSSQQYRGEMTLHIDGTLQSIEHIAGLKEPLQSRGTWKFDPASLTITIKGEEGARFSGPVKGNTSDFTITGRFSDGQTGALRFQRR